MGINPAIKTTGVTKVGGGSGPKPATGKASGSSTTTAVARSENGGSTPAGTDSEKAITTSESGETAKQKKLKLGDVINPDKKADEGDEVSKDTEGKDPKKTTDKDDAKKKADDAVKAVDKKSAQERVDEKINGADANNNGIPDHIEQSLAPPPGLGGLNHPSAQPGPAPSTASGLGGGGGGGPRGGGGGGSHRAAPKPQEKPKSQTFASAQKPKRTGDPNKTSKYNPTDFEAAYKDKKINDDKPGKVFGENVDKLRDKGYGKVADKLDNLEDKFKAFDKVSKDGKSQDEVENMKEYKEFDEALKEADTALKESGLKNEDGKQLTVMDMVRDPEATSAVGNSSTNPDRAEGQGVPDLNDIFADEEPEIQTKGNDEVDSEEAEETKIDNSIDETETDDFELDEIEAEEEPEEIIEEEDEEEIEEE